MTEGEHARTDNDSAGKDQSRTIELEARIATLESELAASQARNAELREQFDDWISLISHDLRGPLTLILGHAESLRARAQAAPTDARIGQGLASIVTAARRLNKMVSQVVDASRLDLQGRPARPREVDLAAAVDDEIRRARREHPDRTIRTHLSRGLPFVYADPRHVSQMVEAMLSNAILFSPGGGDVVVTARLVGNRVALSVRDSGVGVTAEEQPRVFERFYRPERLRRFARPGLGLSLAIAGEFARSAGGEIVCESDGVDRGASFTLTLPLAPDLPVE